MRISVFVAATIDGFIARDNGSFDFLDPFAGEDHGYEEYISSVDCVVVGRATYDSIVGFETWAWPGKRVIVLTHRPLSPRNGETTYAGALAPLATRLANEGVNRVYLDGGIAIRQGLEENLVDDMTISTVPLTIGSGRPLFGGAPLTAQWKLTSVRSLASDVVQAHWEKVTNA